MVIAAMDVKTPVTATVSRPCSSMRQTPPIPMPAPAICPARGGSDSAAHANTMMTTGEVAMMVDAMLVGSACAAR
jgi:hypothetical protein